MFVKFNNNPVGNQQAGDCVIRAISAATGDSWEKVYTALTIEGLSYGDLPNSNSVWDSYLRRIGFRRYICPNECPSCYSIANFASDHSDGTYIMATGSHAIAVINGDWYDSWDSGAEIPIYFYARSD